MICLSGSGSAEIVPAGSDSSLSVSERLGVPGVRERRRFDRGDTRAFGPAGERHSIRGSDLRRTPTRPGPVCEHQRASTVQHVAPWTVLHCGTAGETGTELVQTRQGRVRAHE